MLKITPVNYGRSQILLKNTADIIVFYTIKIVYLRLSKSRVWLYLD